MKDVSKSHKWWIWETGICSGAEQKEHISMTLTVEVILSECVKISSWTQTKAQRESCFIYTPHSSLLILTELQTGRWSHFHLQGETLFVHNKQSSVTTRKKISCNNLSSWLLNVLFWIWNLNEKSCKAPVVLGCRWSGLCIKHGWNQPAELKNAANTGMPKTIYQNKC